MHTSSTATADPKPKLEYSTATNLLLHECTDPQVSTLPTEVREKSSEKDGLFGWENGTVLHLPNTPHTDPASFMPRYCLIFFYVAVVLLLGWVRTQMWAMTWRLLLLLVPPFSYTVAGQRMHKPALTTSGWMAVRGREWLVNDDVIRILFFERWPSFNIRTISEKQRRWD